METDVDSEVAGWRELYARARLMLDEEGVAREERRKEVAAKKLRRAGLEAPPVDLGLVKRTLVSYAGCRRYGPALESTGAKREEMSLAYDLWPEAKTVYEYVQRMRDVERAQDADEALDLATDKLKTLLKDDRGECKVDARLVMQTLERLDRKRYLVETATPAGAKGGGAGSPMVYQVTNVQMNLTGSESLMAALPSGGVVDVDAVVKALEGSGDGR